MRAQLVYRLGVLLLCLTPLAMHGAAPPTPLSAAQKAKLAERDAVRKQLPALIQQRQFDKVIDALQKIAALEKAALGETHGTAIGSLQRLADGLDWQEQFARAIPVRQEVVRLREKSLGKEHWQATDARLALRHSQLLARLSAVDRAALAQAAADNRRVVQFYQQKRHKEAAEIAVKVLAVRGKLLGEEHPEYALSLGNLAAQYAGMGEHGKALPLYLEARELERKVLGEKHPHYAISLNSLAALYQAMGEHGKALPLYREALDLCRKLLGEKHPAYATSLNNLAMLYKDMGEHGKALPLFLEARDLHRKLLGEKHPAYATSLNNLAVLYCVIGEYGKALPLYLEVLDLRRKVLGEKHPDYATSLNNLAMLYQAMGEHGKALPLFLKARDLHRKLLGEKHPAYTTSLNNLAMLYQAMGEHGKALPLFLEALNLNRKVLGEKHPAYATTLNNLGMLYKDMGEHGKALPLYLEALDLRRKVLGEKHPDSATSLISLASLYQAMGEYGKALSLFLEARELYREVLGEKHPDYATSLSNLASLYKDMGEYGKALPLFLEARDLYRKVLGEKHPHYATSLNNLAGLYHDMREHGKALPLYLEARDLYRKVLGEKHPHYAISLNSLGTLYHDMGEPGKALPLFLEARELYREVLGEKHPDYATSLHNLAAQYESMGKHGNALPLYLEALDLRRKVLGEKHPAYAGSLNNLAVLYFGMGEYGKALPLYLEAGDLRRKVLGEKHPLYAMSLNNLALLYQAMGKPSDALAASQQALRVLDAYLEDGYDHLGERQRTQLIHNVLYNLGILLSLHEQAEQPLAQTYAAVLNWKGRVAARQSLDRLLRDRPELTEPLQRLQSLRGRLARLGLQTPLPQQHAAWLKQLRTLSQEKEHLEADLSRRSSELRRDKERRRLTAAQFRKELPADVAFVDLLEYFYYAPTGKGNVERRLLAFVVRHGQEPVAVSLGASKPIADAVTRWRTEVEKPPSQANRAVITKAGQTLRQRVWLKLSKHLGGAKTVVLAPDGVLCQFPLAALPGDKAGSYLIEEVAIAQVASAQQLFDLLQPAEKPRVPTRGLLNLGGVDYGPGKTYDPLPGTTAEVERCRSLFRRASPTEPTTSLMGKAATVQAVLQALHEKRPRFLHLATHGYFEPAERVERLLKGLAASKDGLALWRDQTTTLQSLPGLRCGLALAGANQPPPADDATGLRGILTGEDVAGLDLRGCELAVLSACQTGLGDVKHSQGVLGLQRSFHAAGVRTLLSSLWSVSDAATLELMEEFYSRLWGKEKISRLEALRQAQLAILLHPERVRQRTERLLVDAKKRGVAEEVLRGIKGKLATDLPEGGKVEEAAKRSPEAWWAAFVLSGDWR